MSELTEPGMRVLKEIGSNRMHWDLIRGVLYNIEGTNEEFTRSDMNIAGVECLASRISLTDRGREVLADA